MTESEVIDKLRQEAKNNRADADWKWRHGQINADGLIQSAENMEQIAKWIEELQQYRAIGTVEQLEWCKDASHWKEMFKEKLEQYEAIGTVSEFRELKEKATGKFSPCPKCGSVRSLGDGFCYDCGTALDWSKGKE